MRHSIRLLLIFLPVLIFSAAWAWFCHGVAQSQPIRVEKLEQVMPQWPAGKQDFRVVVLADLHFAHRDDDKADFIVEQVQLLEPDLILFLGDIPYGVNHRLSMPADRVLEHLAPLKGLAPILFVNGNHDLGPQYVDLSRIGATCCDNRIMRINFDAQHPLDVVGYLGAHGQQLKELPGGEAGVPQLCISHYPYSFYRHAEPAFDLIIAGHTHGGQFCRPSGLPLFGFEGFSPAQLRGGRHTAASGGPLYITRGIGCSLLPFRLYCPGEITVLDLRGPAG